jgi:Right handed beta helix region
MCALSSGPGRRGGPLPGPAGRSRRRRPVGLLATLLTAGLVVAGCGAPAPIVHAPGTGTGPVATTSPDGRGAVRPLPAPTGCTKLATDAASLEAATAGALPGDTICVQGVIPDKRLVVKNSGVAGSPIKIVGDGQSTVHGITVNADYVSITGVNAVNPAAPGISLTGNNITLENSTSISPRGDDGDALRFWGNNITIRHNTLRDTKNLNNAHADCMQTFSTDADSPASQHVVIDSNRCEDIDNTCLIMEGPHSLAGDGSGVGASSDITYTNNYCQNRASEALQIDDVQNLTITNNDIEGDNDHAFALQNMSTGAKVSGNKLNPAIHFEVGMDDSSAPGYQGPPSGGNP